MPRRGSRGDERDLFARVVDAWRKDGLANAGKRGGLGPALETFTVRDRTLSLLRKDSDVDLQDHDAWILGRPIETRGPTMFPVVSAALKTQDSRLVGTVRVALFYEGADRRRVDATGWRFESAESRRVDPHAGGRAKPHTFPHAQPCSSWQPRRVCLIHPEATEETGEEAVVGCPDCFVENDAGVPARPAIPSHTRPAFPLRCRTLPGLPLAAIAALYGAHDAREILSTDTLLESCSQEVTADFRHVLGEDDPGSPDPSDRGGD